MSIFLSIAVIPSSLTGSATDANLLCIAEYLVPGTSQHRLPLSKTQKFCYTILLSLPCRFIGSDMLIRRREAAAIES